MEKTFTVAGTSVREGVLTLRYANGAAADRYKVLDKGGHTNILLHDLPNPMTREEAKEWLRAVGMTLPVDEPRVVVAPVIKMPKVRPGRVPVERLVAADDERPIAHEDLGFAAANCSRDFWEQKPLVVRQEESRNAAMAAGIACPRGTYPELEAWLVEDGVIVNEDGTLTERKAA